VDAAIFASPPRFYGRASSLFVTNETFQIQAPSNPISAETILNAPSVIGPCDSLDLDATASWGSGGRLLTMSWDLGSETTDADGAISAALQAANDAQSYKVHLTPSILGAGE
jgi:hypothetical protein